MLRKIRCTLKPEPKDIPDSIKSAGLQLLTYATLVLAMGCGHPNSAKILGQFEALSRSPAFQRSLRDGSLDPKQTSQVVALAKLPTSDLEALIAEVDKKNPFPAGGPERDSDYTLGHVILVLAFDDIPDSTKPEYWVNWKGRLYPGGTFGDFNIVLSKSPSWPWKKTKGWWTLEPVVFDPNGLWSTEDSKLMPTLEKYMKQSKRRSL